MAGAEPGITNHVGYTGNLRYISSRISLVFPPQRYHHSDPCTAVGGGDMTINEMRQSKVKNKTK